MGMSCYNKIVKSDFAVFASNLQISSDFLGGFEKKA